MNIPNLMPYQNDPYNNDVFAQQEVMFLMKKWNLKKACETGTCLGSTTMFLANMFDCVSTIEISHQYLGIAHQRFEEGGYKNIKVYRGDSSKELQLIIKENQLGDDTLFFLDAHWSNHCPVLEELDQIAEAGIKPVIMIHDWKVPNQPRLGYDSYNGQDFTLEWILPHLDKIYGVGGYDYYYNSEDKASGAMRGIVYITPKQRVVLLVGVYQSGNEQRDEELSFCMDKNAENKLIDEIIPYADRPTFNEIFDMANSNLKSHNDIFIIANSDIFFDEESITNIKRYITKNQCFALSRWDLKENLAVLYNHPDSQDVWVFQGDIPKMDGADFFLGVPGCDNRIAQIIYQNGYNIKNPAYTIKTYHLHNSGYRTYTRAYTVPPPYKILQLIKL
jgi:hypothetical protein